MHVPFGPQTYEEPEEHSELPEVVSIRELSAHAIDEAAREIDAQERKGEEEAPEWPTPTG
jgi:hypothetical protein